MLSLTCQIVDTSKLGVSKVFKGGENNLYNRAYWGSYTAEVTQSSKSCHVRIIGPKGHVIENQDMSLNSDKSTLTFDLYEIGNPAWPSDKPASRFEVKIFKGRKEEDALITVTWYSKSGSRIFSLAMKPPKD